MSDILGGIARGAMDALQARAETAEAEVERLRAEIDRMRTGWDADVDWANKLLHERDEAREALAAIARQVDRSNGMPYKMRAAFLDRVGAIARGALT